MLATKASPSPTLSARSSPKSYQRRASPRIRSSARSSGSSSGSGISNHSGASASAVAAVAVAAAAAASAGLVSVTSAPSPALGMTTAAGASGSTSTSAAASSRPAPPVAVVPPPLSPLRRPRSASWDTDPAGPGLVEVATRKVKASPDVGKRLKLEHSPPATARDTGGDTAQKAEEAAKGTGKGKEGKEGNTQEGGRERTAAAHKDEEASDAQAEYKMPEAYELCQPLKLGACIAEMLVELIRINDQFPPKDGQLTRFHSRAPPDISVNNYLSRLVLHATLTPPILLCMVYYIDRLCALYPAFTINSLTVHRYLITAATVACKGLSDSFWTNNTYARVGGISARELASLEMELLARVEWRIVPKPEVLTEYYRSLVGNSKLFWLEGGRPKQSESDQGKGKGKEERSARRPEG